MSTQQVFTFQQQLSEIQQWIEKEQTFVLNIVAQWCTDCTQQQSRYIASFSNQLASAGIEFAQLLAQTDKHVYLSEQVQRFVENLGGHGFPRTLLFVNGVASEASYVEVITQQGLEALAGHFIAQYNHESIRLTKR